MKTLFSRLRVDENGTFRKTLRSHCQFQSTPCNIRNLFKMAEGRQACAVGEVIVFKSIHRIRVDGQNDSKTLRMDANFFEIREKLRFQTNTDTCGKGLKRITMLLRIINI